MATIISIISLILTFLYAALVLFLKKGWSNIPFFSAKDFLPTTKVSIIIAARNEEDKIALTIEDVLHQNYPSSLFELIVVDDHSTDSTAEIIASYAHRGVKLIRLKETKLLNSYKKKAIAEAIADADGELIITTDADCRMSPKWLSTIVNYYQKHQYKLISSPVVYFEEKNNFEKIQTLEFLFLIGLGAAGIGNKMASTCNGANLAYQRETFLAVGGFKGIDDLASGDDELLLHKIAAAYPNSVGFCKSPDALVYTHAKENLKEFIQQRRRWASKSVKYKDKRIVAVAISIWLFNISFLSNFIGAFFSLLLFKVFLVQFLLKLLVEFLFLKQITSFANRKELRFWLPLLTFLHVVYFIYIGIAGNSGKYNWKGRMVK